MASPTPVSERAEVLLDGSVQETGFRAYLMLAARKLKLTGYAENLPDGSVKVVAEGSPERLTALVSEVRSGRFKEAVIELKEQRLAATGDLGPFKVRIGEIGDELFQGFATAGRKLDEVGQKVDTMRSDMNSNFADLRERYGTISQAALSLRDEVALLRRDLSETTRTFAEILRERRG